MVCDGHGLITMLFAQFPEPSVSQFPGSHFYAQAILCSIAGRIEIDAMHTDSFLICPLHYQGLVAIAFLSAKVEIAMSYGKAFRTEAAQPEIGEAHGVDAAADGEEDSRSSRE